MTGKVLAAVLKARLSQTSHGRLGQGTHHVLITVKRPIRDHLTLAIVQIQNRGVTKVHPNGLELTGQGVSRLARLVTGGCQLGRTAARLEALPQASKTGQGRKAIPKPLNAAALVIHRDLEALTIRLGQTWAHRMNLSGQFDEL